MLIVLFLNRAPELRHGRLSQLILVPGALVLALWILRQTEGRPDFVGGIAVIAIIGFTAIMLAPSIAYNFGIGLSNFLDPQDWTPAEEEIALRPSDLDFSYRYSTLQGQPLVVVEVEFALAEGSPADLRRELYDIIEQRLAKQQPPEKQG